MFPYPRVRADSGSPLVGRPLWGGYRPRPRARSALSSARSCSTRSRSILPPSTSPARPSSMLATSCSVLVSPCSIVSSSTPYSVVPCGFKDDPDWSRLDDPVPGGSQPPLHRGPLWSTSTMARLAGRPLSSNGGRRRRAVACAARGVFRFLARLDAAALFGLNDALFAGGTIRAWVVCDCALFRTA